MVVNARQDPRSQSRGLLSGRKGRRLKESLLGYLYISPASVILLAFHLLPVLYALYISLHKWKIVKSDFLGLGNYAKVLEDPHFWRSLKVTVFYVLGTVPATLAISLFLAYLLFQKVRGLSVYRTIFFLPYITSTVASSAVWVWIFNPKHGPLNQILELVGIPTQTWMLEPERALLGRRTEPGARGDHGVCHLVLCRVGHCGIPGRVGPYPYGAL